MKNNATTKIIVCALSVVLFAIFPGSILAYEAAPIALTKSATFITEKSAKLNGEGNSNQVADTLGWFEWGISGRNDTVYQTPHRSLYSSNTLRPANATIVGLAPNTQYYFRYVVESSRGRSVGQTTYFTTKPLATEIVPIVMIETQSATNVRDTSADLRGYVSPHGDTKTLAWFEWGMTQQFEYKTPERRVSGASSQMVVNVKNLTPGTIYFYRAVAENSRGLTYGAVRVFSTTGTKPVVVSEAMKVQNIQNPSNGDGIERTTTTSGASTEKNTSTNNSSTEKENPLTSFFKKKNSDTTGQTAEQGSSGSSQVASVAKTKSPLEIFWNNLTGKSSIEVTVEKVGPKTVPAHSPVEYLVSYEYGESGSAEDARLSISLPKDVVYIGDNTANELMVQDTASGERTYILPLGTIGKDSARSFSILGMTTGTDGGFPDVRVWLEYTNASGAHIVEATTATASSGSKNNNSASVGSASDGGFLPSSFLGWLLYILIVVGSIVGFRKGKEYYEKRKLEISEEEHEQFATTQDSPRGGGILEGA